MRALLARPEIVITTPADGPGVMAWDNDISRTQYLLAVPTFGLTVTLPTVLHDEFARGRELSARYRLSEPTTAVADALRSSLVANESLARWSWRVAPAAAYPQTPDSPPMLGVGRGIRTLRHVPFHGRLFRVGYSNGATVWLGENVAHGSKMFAPMAWFQTCSVTVGTAADSLTRERLLADDAALLKAKFAEAERRCGEQLGAALAITIDSLRRSAR